MAVQIKRINSSLHLDKAFAIRKIVFVDGQDVPADEEYDEFDETANHYLLFQDELPVGTARWRFTENGVKLERFAILMEYRNQGLGQKLLNKILEDIPKSNYVYLHAQIPAVNLYERGGFETIGETFLECEIEHYKMQRHV